MSVDPSTEPLEQDLPVGEGGRPDGDPEAEETAGLGASAERKPGEQREDDEGPSS